MSVVNEVSKLKALLDEDLDGDAEKADKGNRAAATRVRKVMQDVKSAATKIREVALEAGKKGEA